MAAGIQNVYGVLTDLKLTLDMIIQAPRSSLASPKIEAARDVYMAIENVKNSLVHQDKVAITEENSDTEVKGHLIELKDLVEIVKSDNAERYSNIPGRVQGLIAALHIPGWQPWLLGINPRYTAIVANQVTISFLGRFRYATEQAYRPYVTANQITVDSTDVTSERLTFKLPSKIFSQEASDGERDLAKLILCVPYASGVWPVRTTKNALYDIWVGSLPVCPVKSIKVTYSWMEVGDLSGRERKSPMPEGDIDKMSFYATEGYRVKSNSAVIVPEDKKNEAEIVETTDTHVTVKRVAESKGISVKFEELRYITKTSFQEFKLKWGQREELEPKSFVIKYELYDGKHHELKAIGDKGTYLKVVHQDGKSYLVVEVPAE